MIENIIESMPRRLKACIKNNEGHIPYKGIRPLKILKKSSFFLNVFLARNLSLNTNLKTIFKNLI